MPSLAQGYGRGLLLGLQLEEAKRRKQRDELSDEFLRERLGDMRFQRKTLMSQLKREEEERRQAGLEKEQKGWRMAETGVGLRDLLLGAGVTMPQAELAETEYYETEEIPSYAAEWLTPPKAEKPKEFKKAAYKRRLLEKDPKDLTKGQERYLMGMGYRYDPTLESWVKPEKGGAGLNWFEELLGGEDMGAFTPSGAAVEVPKGLEDLDLLNLRRGAPIGAIPEISLPRQPAPLETELPETLTGELQGFESFDEWYDSLPADAQEELEQEPETLRMIRDWYAVSR